MITLNNLKNSSRRKKKKRVGRGPGSGMGKTSGRGHKGAGARSGYRKRYGYEGGQMRLFCKLPIRGFTRGRFLKHHVILNLSDIEKIYVDKEVVNLETLKEKGFISKKVCGIKILANGELNKKVTIEANAFSKEAKNKLDQKKISYKIIELK